MLQPKRTIKAADIIRDLRSGMTIPQLIEKYKISLKALRFVFRRLLSADKITKDDLATQAALYSDTADLKGVRKWLRTTNDFPVRIYDSGSPFATGHLRDISEKGVCVEGLEAVVGEVKKFVVRSGAFGEGITFVFEGKCRWVNKEQLSVEKCVTGFEITNISSLDSSGLQKLIRLIENHHLDRRISESIKATFDDID